jgi:hypothetical protein
MEFSLLYQILTKYQFKSTKFSKNLTEKTQSILTQKLEKNPCKTRKKVKTRTWRANAQALKTRGEEIRAESRKFLSLIGIEDSA